jgi:hypothetical protein
MSSANRDNLLTSKFKKISIRPHHVAENLTSPKEVLKLLLRHLDRDLVLKVLKMRGMRKKKMDMICNYARAHLIILQLPSQRIKHFKVS